MTVSAAELMEGLANESGGATRIASAVLVINGQLFVGFEALAGIAEHFFPHLPGNIVVAIAFRKARQRTPGKPTGFGRQFAGDRTLVKPACEDAFPAPLANARDAEEFERIAAEFYGIGQQGEDADGKRGEAAEVHLIVIEDRDERIWRAAAEIVEIHLRNQLGDEIGAAMKTEDMLFEFGETDGAEAQSPKIARGMQEIEMGAQGGRANHARHAIARFEQRPIEGFSVERDEDGALRDAFGERGEKRVLLALFAHEELLDFETTCIPPGDADHEGISAGAAGESRCFGIEEEPLRGIGDGGRCVRQE